MNDFKAYKLYYPANKAGTDAGIAHGSRDNLNEDFGLTEDMLEQYGVWIKVEPEVILEDTVYNAGQKTGGTDYLDLDELPEDETAPSVPDEDISFDDIDIPNEEELVDSFSSEGDKTPLIASMGKEPSESVLDSFDEERSDFDVADGEKHEIVGEGINEDIGIEEPIDLASEEIDIKDSVGAGSFSTPDDEGEAFSGDLDELSDMELESLKDIDAGEALGEIDESEILPEMDESENLGEFELEESIEAAGVSSKDYADGGLPSFEDGIEDIGEDFVSGQEEIEVPLSNDQLSGGRVDDLADLGIQPQNDEILSRLEKSSIFSKIEKELFAIKKELSEIRSEITSGRSSAGYATQAEPAISQELPAGFFDEEEDETIALTGDELNNILNNADITEEIPDEFGREEDSESIRPSSMEKDKGHKAYKSHDENLYESAPIDKIELEETEIGAEDKGAGISMESSGIQEFETSSGAFDEIEIPDESYSLNKRDDDIALEDELDLEDEGAKPETAPIEKNNIEDLLSKDLEEAEEIELSPEISESSPGFEMEKPSEEDEEIEIVDGIDFDLPDEAGIVSENEVPISIDEPVPIEEMEMVSDAFGGIDGAEDKIEEAMEIGESDILEEISGDLELPKNKAVRAFDEEELLPIETSEIEALDLEQPEEAVLETSGGDIQADSLEIEEILPEEEIELITDEELVMPLDEEAGTSITASSDTVSDMDEHELSIPALSEPEISGMSKGIESKDDLNMLPSNLKTELKSVLSYLDRLLESLPDEKVEEFAKSDYFATYKKLFDELGLSA